MSRAAVGPTQAYRWVDTDTEFGAVVDWLIAEPRYALDTEFHRERTYFPKLALLQLAWPGELVLVDPLAVDVSALRRLFDSDSLAVLHASQQDLDVLTHAARCVPRRLFDTQVAGGFVGYGTPSLVALLQGELGVSPAKGDRLTDWLRRPLTDDQCEYAAADVAYLLEAHDRLTVRLAELGRLEWVDDACAEVLTKSTAPADPDDAWTKLKDARSLRPRARAVAQAVAAWRERRAMATDIPVRHVLPDLAILGIAQRQPTSERDLGQARGVDERFSRGAIAGEILQAVRDGLAAEPPVPGRGSRTSNVSCVRPSRWCRRGSARWRATSGSTRRCWRPAPTSSPCSAATSTPGSPSGWRAELLGSGVRRLVAGKAALTFDGKGSLKLVDLP